MTTAPRLVATLVEQAGGAMRAATLMGVRLATLYHYRAQNAVRQLRPALRLLEEAGVPERDQLATLRRIAPPDAARPVYGRTRHRRKVDNHSARA